MSLSDEKMYIEQTKEDAIKNNVLLMALSTLPKELRKTDFLAPDDEHIIQGCVGQLEPVVKLRLENNPENAPLKIIVMCTADVLNAKQTIRIDGIEVNEKTAMDFFSDRVKSFAESSRTDIEIITKRLDEENPNKGIEEAVEYIRENKNNMLDLWIDTHGGFREVALIMEAIVSLLKVDGIIPSKIYGIRYGRKNLIVDQGMSFSVFDFVSGMNEFIDYGSVSILNRYYSGIQDESILKLLDAMNEVAKGTQECDSLKYEAGLDSLSIALDHLDENDSLLSIFREYVKDSYGVLLDRERRDTIDIVRRCLDKGLVQQALTFIESRMPSEYVKRRLIYCPKKELESKGLTQEQRKDMRPRHEEYYKSDDNFIVDTLLFKTVRMNDEKKYIRDLLHPKNGGSMRTASKKDFFVDKKNRKNTIADRNGRMFTVCTKLKSVKYADAAELLYMHKALKKCRNKFNHCDSDRASIQDIVGLMKEYIHLADEILNHREYYYDIEDEVTETREQAAQEGRSGKSSEKKKKEEGSNALTYKIDMSNIQL